MYKRQLKDLSIEVSPFTNEEGATLPAVRPGFVDTAMAKGEGLFWITPLDKAVQQIYRAILRRKKVAYVSKRWKYVALLLRMIPASIYCKM